MFDKQLIANAAESLALVEPAPSIADPERMLQLYEEHAGYGQWKVIFPGTVMLSAKAAQLFGLVAGDEPLPLQELVKRYQAEDRGKLLGLIAQALQDRRGFHCRLRIDNPGSGVRMIETIADLRIREGRVTELFGASRDVTAEMERELQVQARLKLTQDLFSDMPVPVVMVDDKLRVLDCSILWLKAHRFMEKREVTGKSLLQLFAGMPPEERAEYEAALKGQTVKTRRQFTSPSSNAPVAFNTTIAPWFAAERKVGGLTITVGWSEVAVARTAAVPVEEPQGPGFDGSLLELLETVV